MKKLTLPKKWLSFSQIDLWIKSRETYRQKYYPKTPPPAISNIFTRLGTQITLDMEKREEYVSFIPRYKIFEHELNVNINKILIKAFIDSYNPQCQAFYEYKSGLRRWSKNKVDNHLQLDLYSLCLQEKYGKVQDQCQLIYIQTEKVQPKPVIMDGIELSGLGAEPTLRLTGHHEITKRKITQEDREKMREMIGRIAREISEDYASLKHLYQ